MMGVVVIRWTVLSPETLVWFPPWPIKGFRRLLVCSDLFFLLCRACWPLDASTIQRRDVTPLLESEKGALLGCEKLDGRIDDCPPPAVLSRLLGGVGTSGCVMAHKVAGLRMPPTDHQ
ncbi:hypothetical protein GDO78_019853 [Eleutherodactylus coqui]|uniref:Uncharacterized protein n=1 Tax=Eleutherodactylus coqui TaxID=57060 RepID=A0A8J6B7D2_ELECQ|nr:hypothetical protein GDO78_019853 [Eleutherodactylus coqui]